MVRPMSERLVATPDHCFWGYLDQAEPAVLEVDPGTEPTIEAVTHHSGDAPDLLMDDGIRAIWDGIPESDRAPGVHIMTGPIDVRGAQPGDTLRVELLDDAAAAAVRLELCRELGAVLRADGQGAHHDLRAGRPARRRHGSRRPPARCSASTSPRSSCTTCPA